MKLWCLQGVAICFRVGCAIRLTAHFAIASTILFPSPGRAQIIPDNTLPVNSTVTPNSNSLTIEGGSRAGSNLFHSFREFSLPTGSEAFFNNAIDVQNIFSRVTGSNISNIDGLIRANGTANLFLLNPNGIIFGSNARLNIGGSFITSTANRINFADGTFFSASNPATAPLLTVSVPVGLGFGSNPGTITVQGSGHRLTTVDSIFSPYTSSGTNPGLQVQPGKTLALVGGDINLNGGVLTAPGGRVEVGSIGAAGAVNITSTDANLLLSYEAVSFRNIQLSQRALIDASGINAGSIQVQGRRVSLNDGSVLWMQNRGPQTPGNVNVRATELLAFNGTAVDGKVRSSIFTESLNTGASGNIIISTPQLTLENGAAIVSRAFGVGKAGNINIDITGFVLVSGFSPIDFRTFTTIGSITFGDGKAGDVTLSTQQLSVLNGGTVTAATFGKGAGGNLTVNAEAIELIGMSTNFAPSALSSSSNGAGNAGKIAVNTRTLVIENSGAISTAGRSTGDAGIVTVNALESVTVRGSFPGAPTPSEIRSTVSPADPLWQQVFRLPSVPSGNSRDVTINTPVLEVTDGARINVRNQGIGNAGTLRINAGLVRLERLGSLTATSSSGEGGNIALQAESLQMRQNSSIVATANATGNGGNIAISANAIAALENSDITANAVQGRGGNISINTSGLFGARLRNQQTPESDITASSEFGISGTVAITNPEVDHRSFLVNLPQNVVDSNQQITTGCAAGQENSFSIAGRGGLPEDPTSGLLGRAIWWDNRDLSGVSQTAQNLPQTEPTPEIVEANRWKINAQGQVELVADAASKGNSWQAPANCQTLPLSSSRNP